MEIKPCPFCGKQPEVEYTLNFPPDDWQWYVMCCCELNPSSWNKNKEEAIRIWNIRK